MYHATSNLRIRAALFTALLAAAALSMGPSASAEQALATAVDSDAIQWGPCPPFFAEGCQIGVLHGDPAKPNADVFFRVPGNYDLPRHWHTSAERMILVAGAMDVSYEGQETVSLTPGMYAYGPPKAVHDGRCTSDEACVLFIAFEQPVDAHEVAAAAE